jgi:hypothetical protein
MHSDSMDSNYEQRASLLQIHARRIASHKCPVEFLYFVKPVSDLEQQNMQAVFIS